MDAPIRFDLNEWYAIITTLSMITLIAILPRRFPNVVSTVIFLFGLTVARMANHIFGSKGAFDYYDVLDSGKFEWLDLLTYPMYGMSAYLFIYMYEVLSLQALWKKACFVAAWSVFSVGFEYIAVLCRFFTYKGWRYEWSLGVYLIVQPATLWLYHYLVRKYGGAKAAKKTEATAE